MATPILGVCYLVGEYGCGTKSIQMMAISHLNPTGGGTGIWFALVCSDAKFFFTQDRVC